MRYLADYSKAHMNNRGIITVAKDNFMERLWSPLFGGMFSGKAIRFDGSHDGMLPFINMMTGISGTVLDPDNPIAQIKANRRNIQATVKLVSNALATTPLRVFKTKEKGVKSNFRKTIVKAVPLHIQREMISKATPGSTLAQAEELEEIVGGNPLVDLLRNVNSAWDNFGLKFVTTAYMSLTGDAYWVLLRNQLGVPAAIWIAPSEYMRIRPDENVLVKEYVYRRGMKEVVFPPEDVIHFRLYAPGANYAFHGRGDVAGAAEAFNLAEKIQRFDERVFDNNAFMGGVLSTTSNTNEAQQKKLLAQFEEGKAGVMRAGKWMVMQNVEPKPLMLTPRELDYRQSRQQLIEEMLPNFSVPNALFTGQTSTRAALEASLTQFALFSTAPFCQLMSEALNAQLAWQFNDNIIIAFDNPVQDDKQFQLKRDSIDLKYGVVTADEIRMRDGKEPLGGLSAEPMVDANRIPLSMVGQLQGGGTEQEQAERMARMMDKVQKLRGVG